MKGIRIFTAQSETHAREILVSPPVYNIYKTKKMLILRIIYTISDSEHENNSVSEKILNTN